MTREELLNSAEYWQETAENDCWRENIECHIKLIDENNQWHKVEDELPSKSDEDSIFSNEVLITDGEKVYVGFCSYETKTWYNSAYPVRTQYKITHWRELPQLP